MKNMNSLSLVKMVEKADTAILAGRLSARQGYKHLAEKWYQRAFNLYVAASEKVDNLIREMREIGQPMEYHIMLRLYNTVFGMSARYFAYHRYSRF